MLAMVDTRHVPLDWAGLDWFVAVALGDGLSSVHGQSDGNTALKAISAMFEGSDVPLFIPRFRQCHRQRGGRGPWVERTVPVLPGYAFIGDLDAARRVIAAWRFGPHAHRACPVAGFLGGWEAPRKVSSYVMHAMFAAQERNWDMRGLGQPAGADSVRKGDQVQLDVGPLAEMAGTVQRLRSGNKVEIIAELFGRQVTVTAWLDRITKSGA